MARSLAVAAASLCYESFALVPAEAHLLGTPVLASDIGNVGAAVTPGVDGARFAPGDPAALAAAVRALSANPAQYAPDAIRAGALARYGGTPDADYARLMEGYRQVLEASRR